MDPNFVDVKYANLKEYNCQDTGHTFSDNCTQNMQNTSLELSL